VINQTQHDKDVVTTQTPTHHHHGLLLTITHHHRTNSLLCPHKQIPQSIHRTKTNSTMPFNFHSNPISPSIQLAFAPASAVLPPAIHKNHNPSSQSSTTVLITLNRTTT
jgi:hypothetical protein